MRTFFIVLLIVLNFDQRGELRKTVKYETQSLDVGLVCKKEVNGATCNLFRFRNILLILHNENENVKVMHDVKGESKTTVTFLMEKFVQQEAPKH